MREKKQKENNTLGKIEKILIIFSFLMIFLFNFILITADPDGPTDVNVTANKTKSTTSTKMVNTSGGYISTVNISATVQNLRWKAFVGWVNGRFTLQDEGGSKIYDWNLASTGGEVYATRTQNAVTWASIRCARYNELVAEDTALSHTKADNITTTYTSTANNTKTWVIAGKNIGISDCYSLNTYRANTTQTDYYEQIPLTDTTYIVYATWIENNIIGYDNSTVYDFQILVPENGSALWTSATPYYLYVELN